VAGPIDLTQDIALETVDNQGIFLPMDPRIFTASSLEAVAAGKYDRRHARNISGFVQGSGRLLELGGGIGFVALRAKAGNASLCVAVQDDRPALIQFGQSLADHHFPNHSDSIQFSATPLRGYDDTNYAGLDTILGQFKPDILRLVGTLLPQSEWSDDRLTGIGRILLPFLDPSELDHDRQNIAPILANFGFVEDPSGEANGTLYLRRD
jgi:hypothetical protein